MTGILKKPLGISDVTRWYRVILVAKLKALTAEGRTGWANARVDSNRRKLFLLDSFVLHCPIPGVAHRVGSSPALNGCNNQLAFQEVAFITEGIGKEEFYSNFELRQVAKWLISKGFDSHKVPGGSSEFICMSISPQSVLKKTYQLYPDIKSEEIGAEDRNRYKNLLCLDALYRHVRNSLAHGFFTEVIRKSSDGKRRPYLYLQDNNPSRQITARMFVSYDRLERWAKSFIAASNE